MERESVSMADDMATDEAFSRTLRWDRSLGLLICLPCSTCIMVDTNGRLDLQHFRQGAHKTLPLQIVKDTTKRIGLRPTLEVRQEILLRQPVKAIEGLPIINAFRCRLCSDHCSISWRNSNIHVRQMHKGYTDTSAANLEECKVQTLFKSSKHLKYFAITMGSDEQVDALGSTQLETEPFLTARERVLEQINAAETEEDQFVQDQADKADYVPWISRLGIHEHLLGLERAKIKSSYRPPYGDDDFGTPERQASVETLAQNVVSCMRDVVKLTKPGRSCRLTAPMAVQLCRFTNNKHSEVKPFRAVKEAATVNRYLSLWQGLIYYFWRITEGLERSGCAATDLQLTAFEQCLASGGDDRTLAKKFMQSLVKQHLPGSPFESAVLSYAACLTLQDNGHAWKPAGNFNSSLSGLIWCMQLVIFSESLDLKDQFGSPTADSQLERLQQNWLVQEHSNVGGIILYWRIYLFKVASETVSENQATWDCPGETVLYQGVSISMQEITKLHTATLIEACTILDRELLLEADVPCVSTELLKDNEDDGTTGWWFGKHSANVALINKQKYAISNHIRKDQALSKIYLHDNLTEWKTAPAQLYEDSVQSFLRCIFVLMQLNPPLRGPEALSIKWKNSLSKRNIFIKYNELMIFTTYHKTQLQIGKGRESLRFLIPGIVGKLLLDFLVYVQPFRQYLLWLSDRRLLSPLLFSNKVKPWDSSAVSSILKAACRRAQVPELDIHHWRQIASSIVKMKFSKDAELFGSMLGTADEENDDDELSASMARMSNHSVRTHNRAYANESGLSVHANVYDGMIRGAYRACLSWAKYFDFMTEPPAAFSHRGVSKSGQIRKLTTSGDASTYGRPSKRLALTSPRKDWSGTRLLDETKLMFKDPALDWRVPEQEAALRAILSGEPEVLIVLGTGSGKSLLFQFPCLLPNARTTVLIVPLVALRIDLLGRCKMLGIETVEWKPGCRSEAPLVMISAEAAVSGDGIQYLQRLAQQGQLARIVVDECHLLVIAQEYRRAMSSVRRLRVLEVQWVYLTATLPADLTEELVLEHALTRLVSIRAPTRRANIDYSVTSLLHRDDGMSFVRAATCLIRKTWSALRSSPQDRAIIFVHSKTDAELMATMLQCLYYHSGIGDGSVKGQRVDEWLLGDDSPMIAGTSGLGTGIHYDHVRLVVHLNKPYSLVEFAQESGRAGRDGRKASSLVILPMTLTGNTSASKDSAAMHAFLTTNTCRRAVLHDYLDNTDQHNVCDEFDDELPCDLCISTDKVNPTVAESYSSEPYFAEPEPPSSTATATPSRYVPLTPRSNALRTPSTARMTMPAQSIPATPTPRTSARAELSQPPSSARQHFFAREAEYSSFQDNYRRMILAITDQCLVCRLTDHEWSHKLDQCTNQLTHDFLRDKKMVLSQVSKLIANYHACFKCYQPQNICTKGFGAKGMPCDFPDMVMPCIYVLWRTKKLRTTNSIELPDAMALFKYAAEKVFKSGEKYITAHDVLNKTLLDLESRS